MRKLWIVCLSVCLLFTGCNGNKVKETIKLMEPVSSSYNCAVVTREDIYSLKQYPAYAAPYTENLSFSEAGTVDTIKVIAGDKVEKGQILADLDLSGINKQIEELKASIDDTKKNNEFSNTSAQYDIDIMNLDLDELNKEYKTAEASARKDLSLSIDIKKADIKIAEEKLSQAKQLQEYQLKKQEQNLEDLSKEAENNVIKAPFSGEIACLSNVISGTSVEADESVLVIADLTKVVLKSEYISETTMNKCSRYYALYNNKELEITYVPMNISQFIKITLSGGLPTTSFEIKNMDSSLSIGTYTSVCIINNFKPEVLTIPIEALYSDTDGKYVYLIDQGTKVRRSIEAGITTENSVEVVSGLEEGDVVYVKN